MNLSQIYEKGTAQQLWNAWNQKQRVHFLIDHADMFIEVMKKDFNTSAEEFAKLDFMKLPNTIRKEVIIHHAMGIYKEGGPIKNQYKGKTSEEVWNSWTKQQRAHFISDHEVLMPFRKQANDVTSKKWDQLPDKVENIYIKGVIENHVSSGQYDKGGKLTPAKQKLVAKIDKIKKAMADIKSDNIRKAMQKKIDKLQAAVDYNPSIKQKVAQGTGRFFIDIPTENKKKLYKALWIAGIKPKMHTLNGSTKVIFTNAGLMQKGYGIYVALLSNMGKQAPELSAIKGKL